MADLQTAIADYLASLRAQRWRPGVFDCGVFMADWIVQICGVDPIADVRGSYSTEREFLRIVRGEGGFEACCAARLDRVGMRHTDLPKPGDVLIVLAPYAVRRGRLQRRPTGALALSATLRAVITSDLGVVIAGPDRLPMLTCWTF